MYESECRLCPTYIFYVSVRSAYAYYLYSSALNHGSKIYPYMCNHWNWMLEKNDMPYNKDKILKQEYCLI